MRQNMLRSIEEPSRREDVRMVGEERADVRRSVRGRPGEEGSDGGTSNGHPNSLSRREAEDAVGEPGCSAGFELLPAVALPGVVVSGTPAASSEAEDLLSEEDNTSPMLDPRMRERRRDLSPPY